MSRSLPTQVWLLALIQALAMSGGATMVLTGGIVGAELAPLESLATLPVALMIVGTACGVLPLTGAMRRYGRRKIFMLSSFVAASGALLAAFATAIAHFYLFLSASFVMGFCVAGFQQIRFAAIESAPAALAAKATSTVLLGGLVAAVLGPELASWGQTLLSRPFTGSFALVAVTCVLCLVLFMRVEDSQVSDEEHVESARSRWLIIRQPIFIVAVSTSVIGFALMSFIMTATPVHMHVMNDFSLEQTKWVIQSHIIAMYLPSFINAWLIMRLGVRGVITCGLLVYTATMLIGFLGAAWVSYWLALVMLGFGWNLLFLAGTVLLPRSYKPRERFKVQGIHDFMVFGGQAVAALSAGALLALLGWQGLMQVSAIFIVLHVAILLTQYLRLRGISNATN